MSEQSFKNRRGHNVTIREAVDDIERSEVAVSSKKSAKGAKISSKPESKLVRSRNPSIGRNPKSSKSSKNANQKSQKIGERSIALKKFIKSRTLKVLMIVAAFVIAILILLIGLNADASKRAYDLQAATMQRSVTELTDQPASQDTPASTASKDLADQLTADMSCDAPGVDVSSWYGRANEAKQRCQTVADDYQTLKSTLRSVSEQSTYTESVSKTLRPALRSPDDGTFASLTYYRDTWQETVKDLQKVDSPESMSSVHETLVKNTDAVRAAWQSLVEASVDEDGDKFSQSEKDLTARYATIRDTQAAILQPIQANQVKINELVSRLMLEE